ncbi:NAD(P)/FAD-dependent oxidoreductase [Micrococcus luteus]|uniref:FAD-dependent oxidoreductase n=1 Tax=Micrococcus luteus TaxID=1270 RepID=UPI0020419BB1|nr:FAD-dependent oxidoreductase [Micrococcus luteus]MCM3577975.1 NAD(P)/FAD-dependent oxidoreductase [Micrococcus luteus]MCV7548036.1 NAD(P)/FAD-dependent oxidoreductase [Micrococcus luteus]
MKVGIIGAGAAGTSAAKTMQASGVDIEVDLLTRSGEQPYNRTLVNKGVATGLLEPDQIALPATGVETIADTVRGIDPRSRDVHLDSGKSRTYDALIIASGSRPRTLDETILGRDQALSAGRLTALHSIADAVRVRDLIGTTRPARVLILGGGLVASETASLLTDAGHDVALITRALLPGARALGEETARSLLNLHLPQHAAYLGRTPTAIRSHADRITVVLDDGPRAEGDLAIVAHGTMPAAPAPWTGSDGIPVDDHLRSLHAPHQRIYAAGGVAVHHYPGHSSYRIDHWDDSVAQGAHAARALLHDLGLGDDPGIYLPSSPFSARVHGHTLVGAGHPALGSSTRIVSTDPLLTAHYLGDTPVALTGIDAAALVRDWIPRLHQRAPIRS